VRSLLVLFCLSGVAHAELRCGEWLVSVGAGEAEVAAKCGAPTRTDTKRAVWRTRYGTMRCTIDRWTYDRGPGDFTRILEFKDGVLTRLDVGDYGN
jgi:hypothetical protein